MKIFESWLAQRRQKRTELSHDYSTSCQEQHAWHEMFRKGTIAITGFGYFAERAEADGFTYYNTSLSGKGNQYPDSKSKFLKGADSYILLTLTKNPAKMKVEIKGLDGSVLDRKVFGEPEACSSLRITTRHP